jgi:hypothetical protein
MAFDDIENMVEFLWNQGCVARWLIFDNWKKCRSGLFVLFQKWKEVRYKDDTQFCTSFILA